MRVKITKNDISFYAKFYGNDISVLYRMFGEQNVVKEIKESLRPIKKTINLPDGSILMIEDNI